MSAAMPNHGSQNQVPSGSQLDKLDVQSGDSESDDDPVAKHVQDNSLLSDDPLGDLGSGLAQPVSFKRKPLPTSKLSIPRLFPTPTSSSSRPASPGVQNIRGRAKELREQALRTSSNPSSIPIDGIDSGINGSKESGALDWYIEGPGRRVGYDDLTTIDWIFEYAKERQRLRVLHSSTSGLIGHVRRLLDASNVWIVLVLTGIAVGILAAGINVAGDWLGDIKEGYCHKGEGGGQFYLNKNFCCWGHDEFAQCSEWRSWREALRIPSRGGGYVVEFIFYVLYSVFFALCSSILVKQYAIHAKHSGIPEIKTVLGGFVIRRFMGAWTLVVKSLGLCLSVASGLWAGKEGPLIHVACCCANLIMKPIDSLNRNEARRREIISAAAAAGISVAFGSPIGGVLFSLEQLSYYFPDKTMWQSFVCAMVAAVTLQFMNPFRTGKIVLYQVSYSTGWHNFEVVPFILLGLVGGVYGGLFIKLNMLIAKFRKSSYNPLNTSPVLEVGLITLISALINYPNIFMRAQLSELVYNLFAECAALGTKDPYTLCKETTAGNISMFTLLLTASGLGFLLAALTFGLLLPSGIILPSLAIGALYGRALGIFVQLLHSVHPKFVIFTSCEPDIPCITPGTYAIVGAASALAGVTRMTVSIVVIMFELTGALTYVLPIMIAVMLSKWIGDAISPRGIYESWIQFHGYPFLDNRDDKPAPDIPSSNIMTRYEDLICIPANPTPPHTITTLLNLLAASPYRGYPVISSHHDPILLGYISRTELSYALSLSLTTRDLPHSTPCFFTHIPTNNPLTTLDLRPWMDQTPITLNVSASFALTKEMFEKLGVRWLAFVERGRLRGLVTKKDVWFVVSGIDGATAGGGGGNGRLGGLGKAIGIGNGNGNGVGGGLGGFVQGVGDVDADAGLRDFVGGVGGGHDGVDSGEGRGLLGDHDDD